MQCPVCEVQLVMSSREGIEIDHCPQCRGVWLDRGELDKIIERAAPAVMRGGGERDDSRRTDERNRDERDRDDRYRDGRYRDDRYYGDRHRKKKHRSFLESVFDFD